MEETKESTVGPRGPDSELVQAFGLHPVVVHPSDHPRRDLTVEVVGYSPGDRGTYPKEVVRFYQ